MAQDIAFIICLKDTESVDNAPVTHRCGLTSNVRQMALASASQRRIRESLPRIEKKKNEPRTCNQAWSPPFGGGLTSEAAITRFSPVPFAEFKVEEGDSAGRSTLSLFASLGTMFPVIAK